MKLNYFRDTSFLQAIKTLFNELNVPVNYVSDEPTTAKEILKDTYKDNGAFLLVNEVYFVGMVDDAAFKDSKSIDVEKIKSDYDGILIFGITLNQRENKLLPTRSQLAEISRAFNREFYYTPVILVFKYADDKGQYIAFANTERMQYKQAWREGEKAGKVSLLRDIDIQCPHRGHEDIIKQLRIQTTGKNPIDSFSKLYAYWQEVFSVNILNKRFYQDLSNWYFWAVKQVTFPGEPSKFDALKKNTKLDDLIQEHNATNVIRLLTRLLFTWFIKEKKLIPEELFDLETLQKEILIDIAPYHEDGLFSHANKDSVYYKAILQNLFFASLNCPIKPDEADSRERGFRGDSYGTHRGIDYLMRHKRYFKNPNAFLELMNKTVPFLNGGLFECLDDKYNNTYIDGFSDQMTKGERLIVPDYLFFGTSEKVDLSTEYGINNKTTKSAAVKGLINILKSYKFTITENTPIEEDVALDPELLGKVFENLLASYNPETKTTARKQTGSFYTPREIVNYMVDESIIAYLKNAVTDWEMDEKQVDEKLRHLASFDSKNPFAENEKLINDIVSALDRCKILDPACGSGAFPMGVLQKMVHILQKLDPDNSIWKEVQTQKAQEETSKVFKSIDDRAEREEKLKEINNAFDQRVNDPDYARKLYLIENCIYGVDIQPIATQIAKLRFFISLVVDQKSNSNADENFGIHPLPNLETKFVTANTLIGIDKPNVQYSLYDIKEVKELESELKKVRHKLFNARTKDTKLKYRQRDEELRNAIASELEKSGWKSYNAEKLAKWDPYDQHASSSFFDSEWMFDIADGFDIVIGNPPYVQLQKSGGTLAKQYEKVKYKTFERTGDIYSLFYEKGIELLKPKGILCFITSNKWMRAGYGESTRKFFVENINPLILIDFAGQKIFDSATVDTNILLLSKEKNHHKTLACVVKENVLNNLSVFVNQVGTECNFTTKDSWTILSPIEQSIKKKIEKVGTPLKDWNINIYRGILTGYNKAFIIDGITKDKLINEDAKSAEIIRPILRGRDIKRYSYEFADLYLITTFPSLKIDIEEYPAVKAHLLSFGYDRLKQTGEKGARKKTNNKWFETQDSIAYWEDFNRHKIAWASVGETFYSCVDPGLFLLDTNYFFSADSPEYLLGILNSKLITYWINSEDTPIGSGGAYRHYKYNLERLPIPRNEKSVIVKLVKKLLDKIDKNVLREIDLIVYSLYGLTEIEIDFIENMNI